MKNRYFVDEQVVVEADDWIDFLEEPFRVEFLQSVRDLGIGELRKYPPPKPGRVPFGHELRVFGKFLSGRNAMFDPSALSGLYRRLTARRQQDVYRAFVLGQTLRRSEWEDILGRKTLDTWMQHVLLREGLEGLWCRFHVFAIGRLILIGDREKPTLLRRVLIGQDSHNMAAFMEGQPLGHYRRYLDVGPGSGVILLTVSNHADEAVGMDINPRAVAISRLNADLNQITNCTVHLQNVLVSDGKHGVFDLITWNSPFVFLPEECRNTHYDGFGGHMGMEIISNFIEMMPKMLANEGKAYLAASAPILNTGENLLEARLRELSAKAGLDVVVHVLQSYWHTLYRQFHEAHNIRRFELVHLEITRGQGRVRRLDASLGTRLTDTGRELVYRVLR